jgi:RibD C-terminal domain
MPPTGELEHHQHLQQVVVFSTERGAQCFAAKLSAEKLRRLRAAGLLQVIVIPEASSLRELASGAVRELCTRFGVRYIDVAAGASVRGALLSARLLDEVRVTVAGQLIGTPTPQTLLLSPFSSLTSGAASSAEHHQSSSSADHSPSSSPSADHPQSSSSSSVDRSSSSPSAAHPSSLFEMPTHSAPATPRSTPLVEYVGVRMYGQRHLFVRGLITYQANETGVW